MGYDAGYGPGVGVANADGGAYGGQEGKYSGGGRGLTYGSITSPVNLGSGSNNNGGVGGGAIILNVTGISIVNGSISALGTGGSGQAGGSGGTIFVTSYALSGSGNISVNGATPTYGAGGGGRISITLLNGTDFSNFTGNMSSFGGSGSYPAAAGTIYLKAANQNYGTLIVDNNGVSTGATTLISNNVTYNGTSNLFNFNIINISRLGQLEINFSVTLNLTNTILRTDSGSVNNARLIFLGNNLTFGNTFTLANATLSQKGTTGMIWNTSLTIGSGGTLTH